MFDFEKLIVYQKAEGFNKSVLELLESAKIPHTYRNQLSRASLSILLNLAEGSGRFSNADRRNFFVITRGSVFECAAIIKILYSHDKLLPEEFDALYSSLEEISKITYAMIKNLEKK